MKKSVFALAALSFLTATAGDWSFNAGYAWRSQAKTSFRGGTAATSGIYSDGSVSADGSVWSGTIDELPVRSGGIDTGTKVAGVTDYALRLSRTESIVAGGSEEDSASGLNLSVGYDFYDVGTVLFGVSARFAGYWGIKNCARGGCCSYNDYYRFDSVLGSEPNPVLDSVNPDLSDGRRDYLSGGELTTMRTTLKSDLYQIGLGPKVTWSPFAEWCPTLSWINVYGGVEILCNIAYNRLEAGGASSSSTDCLVGVGGNVGFVGNITDWCGVYGQIGYEWIDKDEVSVGGIRAETDYSSLVLSAGLQFRF